MNTGLGSKTKRFSLKLAALLLCVTLVVQMFWVGDVALGASVYYFRGYDVENIMGSTFSGSGATIGSGVVTMTDSGLGQAVGFVALDEEGYDISQAIDLGGLEIDFSTKTYVGDEGGANNDIPTARIEFRRTDYSDIISSVNLAKVDNAIPGEEILSSSASIPSGTRSIVIYLNGQNTDGTNTVIFENTSFKIRDEAAPSCTVDYSTAWTNQPITVTVSAADSDSGLEGIYVNDIKVKTTSPYTFQANSNMSFSTYSKDYAGKTSTVRNITITNIDTAAPAAPGSLTLSNTNWTNQDVSVTVPVLGTATGAPERYQYRLNSGTWTNLPANYSLSDSGQYTIDVTVMDDAGNRSSAVSGAVKIDKLEPVIDDVDTEVASGRVDVTVSAHDEGLSGLKSLKYADGIRDAEYFLSGSGTTITGGKFSLSEGGVFTIWAEDNAGNHTFREEELNTAPTLAAIADVQMDEDVPKTITLDVADGESDLSELSITATSADTDLITELNVSKSGEIATLEIVSGTNLHGGPVAVTVTVSDGDEQATRTFNVTVSSINDAPVAVDDEGIVTSEDGSIKIDVLANDYDTADGDTLTITNPGMPQHGTTAIVGGQIRYTPSGDYNGSDQFTYTISDGHGGTASATVYISATAVNDPPTAVPDTARVDEDGNVLIDVLDNDYDIDMSSSPEETISIHSIAVNPAHGTAVIESGHIRYTPEPDFFGTDTFQYTIADKEGLQSTATVTVTVRGLNDMPVFVGLDTEYTVDEDSKNAEITFSIKDLETEAKSLMLQAVSLDATQKLLRTSGLKITGLGDSSDAVVLQVTPIPNAFGDVTVKLTLGDGFSTQTTTFLLHITNLNDAPVAKDDELTFTEDTPEFLIEASTLLANDRDIDGDTLSITSIAAQPSDGTVTLVVDADTLSYTPPANFDGVTSFVYVVSDGHGGTDTATCKLTALPVNDAPTITIPEGPYSTNEDTESEAISFTVGDYETLPGNLLVRAATTDTGKIAEDGLVVVNNGGNCTLTVNPVADAYGPAQVTITVSDGSAATSDTLTITINPTPDVPVAVNDRINVPLSGIRTFSVLGNDHDVDGDTLTVVPSSWVGHSLAGLLTFNEDKQAFTYRAANGENGTGTFTYQVSDGDPLTDDSNLATVTLVINSTTHSPTISMIPNQYIMEDADTGDISFTVTDTDLDDSADISVSSTNTGLLPIEEDNVIVTAGTGGNFKLKLKPVHNKYGTSSITVTATDETGNTGTATFTLTVYPGNDAPEAQPESVTIDEDTSAILKLVDDGEEDGPGEITLLANDNDPDEGDTFWVGSISSPLHGYLYRSGDNYIYTPYGNWNGTERLTYTVTDGRTSSSTYVDIIVSAVNDAPVNYSNWVALPNTTGSESTGSINVLSGDYDPDGDAVKLYQIVEQPAYGTAVMDSATGKITYTRTSVSPNSNGADQIKYRIIDREDATGDYRYADAYMYIGVVFHSSMYTEHNYIYRDEDSAAIEFDLSIHNPNGVTYDLELLDTTTLGTLEVVDNNTVRFTPAADMNGADWVDYKVTQTDATGEPESATGSFYIRLYPINDAPVIDSAPDTAECAEDSDGAEFTVTFHDIDSSDPSLVFYAYTTNTTSGSPAMLTLNVTYDRTTGTTQVTAKPAPNANGTTDLMVGVTDGMEWVEHKVAMTVTPVDDAPVPTAVSRTLNEDTNVTFSVITPDSEVDGDDVVVSLEDGDSPAHGSAVVNADGTITYTPSENYNGSDSLTFTVTDDTGAHLSAKKTAILTIEPVNDQPEITNLVYYQTTDEDTPKVVPLTVTDVDNDMSAASHYTITSSNQELIPDGSISISQVSGTDMAITLNPALNKYGEAIITVVASDNQEPEPLDTQAQFKLTVVPVNDSPTALDDSADVGENVGAVVGTTSTTINVTANDSDIEPGTLRVISITNISVGSVVNNGNGTVTYSVQGDYNGTATFDYTIMDAGGKTATATVTVDIAAQNDPPRAEPDNAETTEDVDITIDVMDNDSDPENDALSLDAVTQPDNGVAAIDGTNVTYSPNDDFNGEDTFTYTVSDGKGGTDTAEVTVEVTAVDDAPTIAKYPVEDWTMLEDTPKDFVFEVDDQETSNENLIITMNSTEPDIIANASIVLSTNPEGRKVITVTPQKDQTGVVPVQFKVSDGAYDTQVTWNITIAAVNDAPRIITANITTPEDTDYAGTLDAEDAEGNDMKFYLDAEPTHGSVTVNLDGSYTYSPDENYVGNDSFTVYADDEQPENHRGVSGEVKVTVTPVNDPPVAEDDTAATDEDVSVLIAVLTNDTDVDLPSDTLSVLTVGAPSHGTTAKEGNEIRYVPTGDWSGTDSFSYSIKDSEGEVDTATVTVTVNPINDAPVAHEDSVTTDEDTAIDIAATENDVDPDIAYGDAITVTDPGTASHGTLSVVDGKIRYTPALNYYGPDEFTYTISDGDVAAMAKVTVTVNPVNDPPVFKVSPPDMSLTEDLANGISDFEVEDVETAAGDLTVTFVSSDNTTLVDAGDVVITSEGDGARKVEVNPNDNRNGTATITLRVSDGEDYTEDTFVVVVTAVNDEPTAADDIATTNENTPVTIDVLSNDDVDTQAGNEGDTLTLMTVSETTNGGSVQITGNKAVYTPNPNRSDTTSYTDTFTYTMQDSSGASSGATVTVTVTPINDAPVITDLITDVTIDEDTSTADIPFAVTDEEDDDKLLVVSVNSSNKTLIPNANVVVTNPATGSDRTVKITPVADGYGESTITLTVTDSGSPVKTDTVSFKLTVTPVDDVLSTDPKDYTVVEDIEKQLMVLNGADVDDPSNLTVTNISINGTHGTARIAADGKSVYYLTALNSNEADWFEYVVHDSFGDDDYTIRANITVTPVNDAPTVTMTDKIAYETTEGFAVSDIPFEVVDVDDDLATKVTLTAKSSNPVLVLGGLHLDTGTGADTAIDVKPNGKWNGTTTITLTAKDAAGATGTATFTFKVNGVNEAPVAVNDTYDVQEDELTFLNVLVNDTDGDIGTGTPEAISVSYVTDNDDNAVITRKADGSGVNIQPNANYNGPVTFTYVAKDLADAESNAATVTVNVKQVNDAPVAADILDAATTEDNPVTIDALLLASDIDLDANLNKDTSAAAEVISLSRTGGVLDAPDHGSVSIVDGKLVYTPTLNYNGTDSFEYFVTDGQAQDKATVTVTITQVNDNPVANADNKTTNEDTPTTIDVMANDTDVDTNASLNLGSLHSKSSFTITLTGATVASQHGSATVVANKVEYVPHENWYGEDTFTYWLNDGNGGSAEGTVTVTVNSVNDLPIFATSPAHMSLTEDMANGNSNFSVSDVETPWTDLAVTVISSTNPTLVAVTDVSIVKGTDGARTVTVNPKDNQNGTADIKLRVTDGNGGYNELTFTVDVAADNDDPVANDDAGTINEDTSFTMDWTDLTSDVDIATNADALTASITTQALHGEVEVVGDDINYTPDENWNGIDSFVYTVTDKAGATDTGTVAVTVLPVNDAPIADNDTGATNEDTSVTVDVLDGDTDVDQNASLNMHPNAETEVLEVTLTGATAPQHGTVSVTAGKELYYTPDANFNGTDTFTYVVTDGELQDIGTVTITVAQVNDNPQAKPDTETTNEDTPVTIDVMANDTDVDTNVTLNLHVLHSKDDFTITLTGATVASQHGSATVVANKVEYVPHENWYGEDTFTYWLNDGNGGSAEGTVTVTVNSVNDLPIFATSPAHMSLTEDMANGNSNFSVSDVETPWTDLAVTVISSTNPTLVAVTDVSIVKGTDGARTVTVNPKDNQNGTADITLRVTDGNGGYNELTFTVDVSAYNDDPFANDDAGTINEDARFTTDWTDLASDVDIATNADALTASITTLALHGEAEVVGDDINYTPDENWNGIDSFVYTVTDKAGATDTGTVAVTVLPVNDAPIADNDTGATNEDTSVTVDVLDGDTDVDQNASLNMHPNAETEVLEVTLTGATAPQHGTVSVTAGKELYYTPDANFNGTDTFTYVVTDGELQDIGTVTITVAQVNDNPIAADDFEETEEDTNVTINVLDNDTDIDTDADLNKALPLHTKDEFSVSLSGITTPPQHGTISLVGNSIVFNPETDWDGVDTFTYWLLDGHGGSDEGTVTVSVGGENDPPVANDDTMTADEDNTAVFNVLDNDTDQDLGDSVSFVSFVGDTTGLHGVLSATSDGEVTFVPDENWNGSFTVRYQIEDEDGLTDEADITITINPVNDNPTADDDSVTAIEDTPKTVDVSTLIDDIDIATNGDNLSISVETGDGPAHGTVTVSGTVITYTPSKDWNGTDSFVYTVTDDAGGTDTATITIAVSAVNDKPVAVTDTASVNEDSTVLINVLSNDDDADMDTTLNAIVQDALTLEEVLTQPTYGTAVAEGNSIRYTPSADFNGTDSFTYRVTDGMETDTGTVTVTVRQVNDNPVANQDTAQTTDGDAVLIDVLANDADIDTDSSLNLGERYSRSSFAIVSVSVPTNGSAVVKNGKVSYLPDAIFAGNDSFTYTMSDGHGGTATATVNVTVVSANDPPNVPVVSTPANGQKYGGSATLDVKWTCYDIDGDALTYTLQYFDGSVWRTVATGLTDTTYRFPIPSTLTTITNLQFRVSASDAEFTSDYGYSGRVSVDKDTPKDVVVTMKTADGKAYTAGTWTRQDVIVTAVSATDASTVTFRYALEDKAYAAGSNKTVTSGVHNVFIEATDEFGNKAEFGGYLARIDKQAPAVPDSAVSITEGKAVIKLSLLSDPGGSGNLTLTMPDGTKMSVSGKSDANWTAAKNGEYKFSLADAVGNSTEFTVNVSDMDETPPQITCDSNPYVIGETSTDVITADLKFTDDVSEVTVKGYAVTDSSSYNGVYSSYKESIKLADPGTYYIHAMAQNAFGLTTNKTFGPFIIAGAEPVPSVGDATPDPVAGDVLVNPGTIVEGAKKIRLPGGEWTDTLTLEDVPPGTYLVEVMDADGNTQIVEITITEEAIAAGIYKPRTNQIALWLLGAGIGLGLLLLLLLWKNVTVEICAAGENGHGKVLRKRRWLKRRKNIIYIDMNARQVADATYGNMILGKSFTKRMENNTVVIRLKGDIVLEVLVPKDTQGCFKAKIDSWR